jgi:predicted CxxxxCH...CXXCH cytochrome family protein
MNSRALVPATLVVLGLSSIACGSARTINDTGGLVLSPCTTCHGGEDNQTGAPPRDVSGRSDPTLPSVGAHTAHVQTRASSVAVAFDCDACHVKPTTPNAAGHGDGTAQITFGALSTANGTLVPSYGRASHGCANVYCHGAFPGGNASNVPVWTAGSSQAVCGTCHGSTLATPSALPGAHARLADGSTNATCNVCHPGTVKADGTIDVAGGKHVDGSVQVDPAAVHPAGWLDPSSAQFHGRSATTASPVSCERCHAVDAPARVTTVVCNSCHNFIGEPIAP